MTGAGSASPVVSMTRRENSGISPCSERSISIMSVRRTSPRTVQHRQPEVISTIASGAASTSMWSSPTSPNSLITTAVSEKRGSANKRFSRVVLPAPRKPVRMVTGIVLMDMI